MMKGNSMARRGFMDLLAIPWVDKTMSVVASLPFAVELYRRGLRGIPAGSPLAVVPRHCLRLVGADSQSGAGKTTRPGR